MVNKFFGFPGWFDILIILALILSVGSFGWGVGWFLVIAVIRVALSVVLLGINVSRKGLFYDFLLSVICVAYYLVWGGESRSMVVAYIGCAAATELVIVFFVAKWRMMR